MQLSENMCEVKARKGYSISKVSFVGVRYALPGLVEIGSSLLSLSKKSQKFKEGLFVLVIAFSPPENFNFYFF